MECHAKRSTYKDKWELLYNHLQLCESLIQEGVPAAKMIFAQRVSQLISYEGGNLSDETAIILLTSLNRSLYDYLLYQLDSSFSRCCYENRLCAHAGIDYSADRLCEAGEVIINAYADELRHNHTKQAHVEHICAYVRANLTNDLTLKHVACEVYLSRCYICQLFKTSMGCTFGEYVRRERMRHAREMLLSTDKSIEEIATACGFGSATYFATVFKNATGMTPSIFRQNLQ